MIFRNPLRWLWCGLFLISGLFNGIKSFAVEPRGSYASVILTSDPHEIILGDSNAPLTVIEYTALSCEVCADFHKNTLPEIDKKYISTGKVKFIIRHFPIDAFSLKATAIINEVPLVRRLAAIDLVFAEQKKWLGSRIIEELSHICKLPLKKCQEIVKDDSLLNASLQHRLDIEKNVDIQGTPTFFINGKSYASSLTLDQFDKIISQKEKDTS